LSTRKRRTAGIKRGDVHLKKLGKNLGLHPNIGGSFQFDKGICPKHGKVGPIETVGGH